MSELTERALRWQQIVDEFCEFNPYADRVIMGNFAGWLAARGVSPVASRAGDAPPEMYKVDGVLLDVGTALVQLELACNENPTRSELSAIAAARKSLERAQSALRGASRVPVGDATLREALTTIASIRCSRLTMGHAQTCIDAGATWGWCASCIAKGALARAASPVPKEKP